MEKLKIDERAVKIAKGRLERERRSRKASYLPHLYIEGYHEAICDFILDYTGEDLRLKELDALNEWAIKIQETK